MTNDFDSTNPAVDVIIPVYNGARYLAEAIQSVLDQTYTRFAVIVVDDGSDDDSAAVAAQFPGVQLLRQPHRGIAAALNRAVSYGNSPLVASLDADDRWLPGKLALQVQVLVAEPAVDLVFGYTRQFVDVEDEARRSMQIGDEQPGISRCAMLVRRTVFDRVGLFTEADGVHSFIEWYARVRAAGLEERTLRTVVFERRVHADNLGRRMTEAQRRGYLQALRLSVTRRHDVRPSAD